MSEDRKPLTNRLPFPSAFVTS